MHEPDDYGRSPAETLATIGPQSLPRDFQPFWNAWHTRVYADTPRLTAHSHDTPDIADPLGAPGVTHTIESVGGVSVGARLVVPGAAHVGAGLAAANLLGGPQAIA